MTPTVTNPSKASRYAQLEGVPLKLALLDNAYQQLHTHVMCKDYIQDAFWSEITKADADVYGFKWSPGRLDPNQKSFMLSLELTGAAIINKVPDMLALLNKWDGRFGFKPCTIIATTDPKCFVLKFSHEWTSQPIRLSLFTTLIRTGLVYDGSEPLSFLEKISTNDIKPITYADSDNVGSALTRIKKIWANKEFPKQTYEQFKTSSQIHNGSGVVAYQA